MASNKYFQELEIEVIEESDNYTKVVAEPFDRGYGVTIGNTLRRSLLTSIPGAAITSIKIDGVSHEFSIIEGVIEDLPDIILNLKEIRFKYIGEANETITIQLKGPREFTARDIGDALKEFDVLNPDTHIATLTEKAELTIDIKVVRGKGYSPAEKNKRDEAPLGTIFIDSLFNPITNVAYEVQPIPASREGHEKLTLEVFSDGAYGPKDAVNHAAKILRKQIGLFLFTDSSDIKAVDQEKVNETLEIKSVLLKSIDEMELSVRSHNCLQAAGIRTIGELVNKEESEMLRFRNFGRKSLTELIEKLSSMALTFGMDVESYLESEG
jgi:DNA-directed RNA polymerase subunit alpha